MNNSSSFIYPNVDDLLFLQENANKLERFTLYGICTYGKIISVYDGDTFDMTFIIPSDVLEKEHAISKTKSGTCLLCCGPQTQLIMRMKCRLNGIDARELKSEGGPKAKEILEGFVLNKVLRCTFSHIDKYGRQLVHLYFTLNGIEYELNQYLKNYQDYFVFYDGGTKTFSS